VRYSGASPARDTRHDPIIKYLIGLSLACKTESLFSMPFLFIYALWFLIFIFVFCRDAGLEHLLKNLFPTPANDSAMNKASGKMAADTKSNRKNKRRAGRRK